jgi:hypothetical protein
MRNDVMADKCALSIVVCASEINTVLNPLRRGPAGGIDAKFCFHPGNDQLFDASLIKFTQQFGIPKTAGMALGENNILLLHVQLWVSAVLTAPALKRASRLVQHGGQKRRVPERGARWLLTNGYLPERHRRNMRPGPGRGPAACR